MFLKNLKLWCSNIKNLLSVHRHNLYSIPNLVRLFLYRFTTLQIFGSISSISSLKNVAVEMESCLLYSTSKTICKSLYILYKKQYYHRPTYYNSYYFPLYFCKKKFFYIGKYSTLKHNYDQI